MKRDTSSGLSDVVLREVTAADLPIFFEQQQDAEANFMAAFTAKDPTDRDAFMAHWARIVNDVGITKMAVLLDGAVAGHISSFEEAGRREVSYWIGKPYWGRGLATWALADLLVHLPQRPLYARAAKDNVASLRVLEKCGFMIIGEDAGFANARGAVVAEYVLELRAAPVRL